MKKKILLVGGGGYCKQIIEMLFENDNYDEIGIVEKDNCTEPEVMGVSVVGSDGDLKHLFEQGWSEAIVSLGSVGDTSGRRRIYNNLKEIGFLLPQIIARDAHISNSIILGEGCIVHPGAILDANTKIGVCSIINKGNILSHDCIIGDFVHVSPGCVLLGNVCIGDDTHVGAASSIREGVVVGANTMIGMGSVVLKNIPDNKIAFGYPCEIRKDK